MTDSKLAIPLATHLGDLVNRKLSTAAVAICAVVGLSACGSSSDTQPAAKVASSSSSAVPTTSSPTTAAGGAVDGQSFATEMVDAMIASKTAHMTMATSGKPTGEGDVELGSPVKVAMKMSVQGRDIEIVQLGSLVYLKGIPGTPKPWLKLDPKGTDAFSKAMSSVGDLSKSSDPRAMVSMMKGVKGKDLGPGRVDGVSTRRYGFEIPISNYGKAFGTAFLKQIQAVIKKPITMEYSVSDDHLLRKITTVMVVSGKKATSEHLYSDWGKPVRIVAPPVAQVGAPPKM